MKKLLVVVLGVIALQAQVVSAADQLVVHEWGTFTSLHDEQGRSLRSINTDDEPVPGFVHQLWPFATRLVSPIDLSVEPGPYRSQGGLEADPRVTMRLETPVLYFHLPPSESQLTLDLNVEFRRGFLTEFFPKAISSISGPTSANQINSRIVPRAGSLRWNGVQVGSPGSFPETSEHVWLAPRKVRSAPVIVGNESEQYLFYRGIGDLESPLQVVRQPDQTLNVRINQRALKLLEQDLRESAIRNVSNIQHELTDRTTWEAIVTKQSLWLLDVRPNGQSAFRSLATHSNPGTDADNLITASAKFSDEQYSSQNLVKLRSEMREALIADGLFADEADAMLNTWELSYFVSPGQRLFYILPRSWTDAVLPLSLSVPAEIIRVMVGRIELVTPRQRQLIDQIAAASVPEMKDVVSQMRKLQSDPIRRADYNALASGRGDSSLLQVPVPPSYQAFLDLGRFRRSLILDAINQDPGAKMRELDLLRQFQFELLYPGKLKRE